MLVSSFMRGAHGLTLYAPDGSLRNLAATDYDLPKVFEALERLIKTGDAVEIDYDGFKIARTVADLLPDARVVEYHDAVSIEFADLGLQIRNVERLKRHLQLAERSPEAASGMRAFLANVAKSHREHSVDDLLDFMIENDLPITPDGFVLAFKFVHKLDQPREDGAIYVDQRTGKMDNTPGQLVWMKPEDVNPDRNVTCSFGLHACARGYLAAYRTDTILCVKIHPAHIIAVPTDYSRQKARVCAHLNLGFLSPEDSSAEKVEFFARAPAAPHLNGQSITIEKNYDPIYADLVAALTCRNIISEPLEETADLKAREASPERKRAARPKAIPFYILSELATATARTVGSLRSLAARRGWKKRLGATGFLEVQPDRDFIADEITGWMSIEQYARKRHRTPRDMKNLARRSGWGMRTVNKTLQIKPA